MTGTDNNHIPRRILKVIFTMPLEEAWLYQIERSKRAYLYAYHADLNILLCKDILYAVLLKYVGLFI